MRSSASAPPHGAAADGTRAVRYARVAKTRRARLSASPGDPERVALRLSFATRSELRGGVTRGAVGIRGGARGRSKTARSRGRDHQFRKRLRPTSTAAGGRPRRPARRGRHRYGRMRRASCMSNLRADGASDRPVPAGARDSRLRRRPTSRRSGSRMRAARRRRRPSDRQARRRQPTKDDDERPSWFTMSLARQSTMQGVTSG